METIFWISLAIPRPSRFGIHWPSNFSKKNYDSVHLKKNKKKVQNWREEKGPFSFLNCPNFVTIFCQVLKMKKIKFFDIPSNPPPIAVRNSLTNLLFPKKFTFLYIFKKKKKCQFYIGISILVIPDHMYYSKHNMWLYSELAQLFLYCRLISRPGPSQGLL